MQLHLLAVKITSAELDLVDEIVRVKRYRSRSAAVRHAILTLAAQAALPRILTRIVEFETAGRKQRTSKLSTVERIDHKGRGKKRAGGGR